MTVERGPVVHQHLLMRALVELRHARGLTQQQVARALDWSHAKLMRYEGGQQVLPQSMLDALLVEYGVAGTPLARELRALGAAARRPAWWAQFRRLLTPDQRAYIGLEAGADTIRHAAATVLPDLLQTRAYARCIAACHADPGTVDTRVEVVMRRQATLASRALGPRQRYLVSEAALRLHVGVTADPGIMVRQLHHLEEAAGAPEVEIRVIPYGHGEHLAMVQGPFALVGFGADLGLDDVLFARAADRSLLTDKPADTRRHTAVFEDEWERLALPAAASVRLIQDIRTSMLHAALA
ncbi:helix-turn-helix domain-containing protein [Nocardiopsis changdeensis]|uniref:Helix-turn-helix domain-containing protein n=1 Tax=Nocardiopsis changdeensis TaxID=2831969 RepID=A0A975KSU2_9ACTN|nr:MULTISPECIES: helix-turn-helix transcriptional regulator [Nocardiopsis]QUX26491.1 helix-turn-helix domain-containing protein [Nocardiopsis changdeensis]QYX40763.1 helix-turn-helix domain-containing protein [Nocardiopsis sp. MT53]